VNIGSKEREQRRLEIRKRYPCIANCEQCGQCAMFHGHDAETAFADYIEGRCTFEDVLVRYKKSWRRFWWSCRPRHILQ